MAFKREVDNALLEYRARQEGYKDGAIPRIEMQVQSYPRVTDRVMRAADGITSCGAFYLIMVPLCVFVVFFD